MFLSIADRAFVLSAAASCQRPLVSEAVVRIVMKLKKLPGRSSGMGGSKYGLQLMALWGGGGQRWYVKSIHFCSWKEFPVMRHEDEL